MGLTRIRAEQISDIDFKQAVRVCSTTNVTLAGGAPNSVDDVNLSAGDRVLVTGQTNAVENGIYQVQTVGAGSNGTWVRSYDANAATGELESGMIVQITEGTANGDTQWVLKTDDPIVVGTTELVFQRNVGGKVTVSGSPPSEPKQGDYWIDSDTGVEYIYFNDGTTSQWAEMEAQYNYSYAAGNADFTQISSNLLPTFDDAYDLGNATNQWQDAYLSGNVTANNVTTAGSASITGTIYVGNRGEIFDDGNFHIHCTASGDAIWINTNAAQLNLLAQPTGGGSVGTGVGIGTSSLTGFVTIQGTKSWTTSSSYGYLINSATPTGQYNGGSQTITDVSLYANGRLMGIEIDALSDERAKNIQGNIPLDSALTFVKSINGILYTWKPEAVEGKDTGLKSGFSAQKVHKAGFGHMIGMVPNDRLAETTDEDGWTSPDKTQLSMNYLQAIPYHHEVIKHLLDRIEQLEATVADLKYQQDR